MTFPKRTLPGLLFLMMLGACATTQPTPVLHSQASPVRAVPCVNLPVMRFHAPTSMQDAKDWADGTLPDPVNAYDTPETVKAIRRANAARGAVCGP